MHKLHAYLRQNSIKTSMIVYFMGVIAIIVLSLSVVSFQNTVRDSENISINYTERLLREVNASIDSYIENMKNMGTVVVENKDVRELMAFFNAHKDAELSPEEQQQLDELKLRASTHMGNVAQTRGDITNIAIVSKHRDVVLSGVDKQVNPYSQFNLSDWFLKPMSYKDDIVVSPSHVQDLVEGEYPWVISISKAISDPNTGEVTGVMLIDLNYKAIEDICENVQLGKGGYIYLLDAKGSPIYHPQLQLIFTGVKQEKTGALFNSSSPNAYVRDDAESKIYVRNLSDTTGWSAVGVVNTQELIPNRSYLVRFYFVVGGVAILFAALFAVLISTNITRPLKKLETSMHQVEEGSLEVRAEVEQDNEIGQLSKTFNTMVGRIGDLVENEKLKEEEKRKSEIKALQAQINPHFLYNTLETIIWLSASGKNDEVVNVTSALAQLFRTSISQGDSLVAMQVELDNIESYLTIQKMRYQDKLQYSIQVDEALRQLRMPKLILQPIVENAIYHGVKPQPEGGAVDIRARREGDTLVLTVQDTGVGMTDAQAAALFQPKPRDSQGIGVLNVQNRIQLLFGGEYGLFYSSPGGVGTQVEIRLPAREGGEEDA